MKGLGERIKVLRKTKNLTLVEVAKSTGIDQATLSRIENGKMTGTLDSHRLIADVLGIRLPELYESVMSQLNEAKDKLAKKKIEHFSHSSGAMAELLTTGFLQKKMMPVLIKIKPRGKTESEEYSIATERFVYVIKGAVELRLGQETKLLKQYESSYFPGFLPHQFVNKAKTEAWMISVITPSSL